MPLLPSDEMSGGAKLAVAGGLLVAGGLVAWWIAKPSAKTASGPALRATYPGLGVAPGLMSQPALNADYLAGYAAGQHAETLANSDVESAPSVARANIGTMIAIRPPPAVHSAQWDAGYLAGFRSTFKF